MDVTVVSKSFYTLNNYTTFIVFPYFANKLVTKPSLNLMTINRSLSGIWYFFNSKEFSLYIGREKGSDIP